MNSNVTSKVASQTDFRLPFGKLTWRWKIRFSRETRLKTINSIAMLIEGTTHADFKPLPRPPLRGWKVPYDGPVDDSFSIGAAGPPAQAGQADLWGRKVPRDI